MRIRRYAFGRCVSAVFSIHELWRFLGDFRSILDDIHSFNSVIVRSCSIHHSNRRSMIYNPIPILNYFVCQNLNPQIELSLLQPSFRRARMFPCGARFDKIKEVKRRGSRCDCFGVLGYGGGCRIEADRGGEVERRGDSRELQESWERWENERDCYSTMDTLHASTTLNLIELEQVCVFGKLEFFFYLNS